VLALVVLGRGGFVVGHFVFEHAVDKNGELASSRRNGFGLVRASGQPAVERPKRMISLRWRVMAAIRKILAARFVEGCVRELRSFPPEILLFGASVSQEVK